MEELVKLFFLRPLTRVIVETQFSYSRIISVIPKYCEANNIEYEEIFNQKKDEFFKTLFDEYKTSTLFNLAKKYKISVSLLKKELIEYCKKNNMEYNGKSNKKAELDPKVIYELKNKGTNYKDIERMFSCSYSTVRNAIEKYCEENNLDYEDIVPKKEVVISGEDIYNLKVQGKTLTEIAEIFNCSAHTVSEKLRFYCIKNNLDYESLKIKLKFKDKINLDMKEVYELKKKGFSYKELANKFNCCPETLRRGLTKYCEEKDLDYETLVQGSFLKFYGSRGKFGLNLLYALREILKECEENNLNGNDKIYVKK